jgi:hypothetical protein
VLGGIQVRRRIRYKDRQKARIRVSNFLMDSPPAQCGGIFFWVLIPNNGPKNKGFPGLRKAFEKWVVKSAQSTFKFRLGKNEYDEEWSSVTDG